MFRAATLLVALLSASAGAHASITLTATMTPDQESTPVVPTLEDGTTPRPSASGFATFIINDAMTSMSFEASVTDIDFTGTQTEDSNDDLVNAHIHAGANVPPANNPVVWGFIGMPFNDTSPTNTVVTPFATGVGGTVTGTWDAPEGNNTTFAAQLENILAGRAYINFHTVQFPGGEVRGALVAPIPEPETYSLMLAGLGAIGWIGRRRKQRRAD